MPQPDDPPPAPASPPPAYPPRSRPDRYQWYDHLPPTPPLIDGAGKPVAPPPEPPAPQGDGG